MTKYRIVKIHPNCKPGGNRFAGKKVDAVLEVPAGTHMLAHGQIIEVEDNMDRNALKGQCPACKQAKIACKGLPACHIVASQYRIAQLVDMSLEDVETALMNVGFRRESGDRWFKTMPMFGPGKGPDVRVQVFQKRYGESGVFLDVSITGYEYGDIIDSDFQSLLNLMK